MMMNLIKTSEYQVKARCRTICSSCIGGRIKNYPVNILENY
jgi:hypothetical protein